MSGTVFGPVPSRRFGRSLGVDLVPYKTCPFDCIYCQLGRTTDKTVERRVWVPVADVLADVRARLDSRPDYITLSGSGEPTLHAGIGEIIAGIKGMTSTPVAVLTNGALLADAAVRRALGRADVVAPSLDSPDATLFQYVNRPHSSLRFDEVVGGLLQLRGEYEGQIWLEVFLIAGVTAMENEVSRLAAIAEGLKPDRIHLNTASRPTAESYVDAVPLERMRRLAAIFGDRAAVIAAGGHTAPDLQMPAGLDEVMGLLARRPCTAAGIATGLGMHLNEALKYVGEGIEGGSLETERCAGTTFFRVSARAAGGRSTPARRERDRS
jgi:wyosine [tRNA(Phe)-imidazoG37] synthetase (radical SAM superfamily)